MSNARVDRIQICDFRGFPADVVAPIVLGGKNLLLYGENGSGKSTIFQALAQLLDLTEKQPFDSDLADAGCLKNRFTDPGLKVGQVRLDFTQPVSGGPIPAMAWTIDNPRPSAHPYHRSMGRTRGFLDYRAVLQTHFVHRDRAGINLFSLIVESLLRDVELPNSTQTFGEEWAAVRDEGKQWLDLAGRDPHTMDDVEKIRYGLSPPEPEEGDEPEAYDEAEAFQAYVALERRRVSDRIQQFNDALWQRVSEIQSLTCALRPRRPRTEYRGIPECHRELLGPKGNLHAYVFCRAAGEAISPGRAQSLGPLLSCHVSGRRGRGRDSSGPKLIVFQRRRGRRGDDQPVFVETHPRIGGSNRGGLLAEDGV